MTTSLDSNRRLGAGICLIAAPALLLIGDLLVLGMREDNNADWLAEVATGSNRWFLSAAISLVGVTLFIPAVLGIVHLLRRRTDSLGLTGGGLSIIGLVAVAGIVTFEGLVVWLMAQRREDPAMASLLNNAEDSVRFSLIFIVSLAFFVGMVLLAIGLYRSGVVPQWVAILLALGTIVLIPGRLDSADAVIIVGDALYLVALGWIGWMVLSGPERAWEAGVASGSAQEASTA